MITGVQRQMLANLRASLGDNPEAIAKFEASYGERIAEYEAAPRSDRTDAPMSSAIATRESSQELTDEVLAAARAYADAGYKVIPLKHRGKEPDGGWTGPPLADSEIIAKFSSGTANIGIVFGAPSRGLADLDFDSSVAARIADSVLDELPAYGRAGAPRSHRFVLCKEALSVDGPCRRVEFKVPASVADQPAFQGAHGAMILEVRANGCFSMAPPSTHPCGEKVIAEGNLCAPPEWFWDQIVRAGGLIAFLDLCVRLYPPVGTRHVFCMALTGTLLRALMNIQEFKQFADDEGAMVNYADNLVRMVGDLAGGGKSHKLKFAANTLAKIKSNLPATGLKTTLDLLGIPDADHGRIAHWLGGDPDERARIEYNEIDIRRVLGETEAVFLETEAPVFQRGGQLAHVFRLENEERVEKDGKLKWSRPAGSLVIRQVGPARLRLYADEYIRFYKEVHTKGATKQIRIPAPYEVARDYIAMIDECRLRVLRGTLETPTMRDDDTILETPGYDQQSGLLLETGGVAFPLISPQLTKQDAETALKIIDEVIKDFPFDQNPNGLIKCPSRSVAISMFLSVLVGRTMPAVPMHLFDAPAAGTGKSLLVDCAAIIGTGKVAAKMAQGRDEAEDEKRLGGAVLQGDAILCVDNVEQALGGDFLCSLITEPVVQIRPLGQTGNVEVPANLLLCATGNNIKVRGDMARRAIKCRLDANREHPEERSFQGDLRDHVRENRAKLVAAGLTIMRAFAVASDRQQVLDELTPYGSFEKWSERVRGALVWLGEVDPCASRESIRDDDPITINLAALVAAWVGCPELGVTKIEPGRDNGWYLVDHICAASGKVDRHDGEYVHPALRAALEAIMPRGITPDSLGRYLTRYVDRIVGGYRLRKRQHPVSKRAQYAAEAAPKTKQPVPEAEGPVAAEFDFAAAEAA